MVTITDDTAQVSLHQAYLEFQQPKIAMKLKAQEALWMTDMQLPGRIKGFWGISTLTKIDLCDKVRVTAVANE